VYKPLLWLVLSPHFLYYADDVVVASTGFCLLYAMTSVHWTLKENRDTGRQAKTRENTQEETCTPSSRRVLDSKTACCKTCNLISQAYLAATCHKHQLFILPEVLHTYPCYYINKPYHDI
jgi:hypothetical protein